MCPNVLTCGEHVCVYEYVDMICVINWKLYVY